MELPDFGQFEPFLSLREKMGATRLGSFEFFDPKIHLTAQERLVLLRQGILLPVAVLRKLSDRTIAFKNARVLVWPESDALTTTYHLSWCDQFPTDQRLRAGVQVGRLTNGRVCQACLDLLQYEGHNSNRHRHEAYYEKVRAEFDVRAFFSRYPHYPLR